LDVDETVLKLDTLARFDYVALGHIHKYEMFSSFTGGYTGSLFVKDFGEAYEKFFNVLEFQSPKNKANAFKVAIKKCQVPERRFAEFILDVEGMSVEDALELVKKEVKDVEGAVIKLKLSTQSRFNPHLIYNYLRECKVFHYAPIDWQLVDMDRTAALEVKDGMSDIDVVTAFLETQTEIDPDFKAAVQDYAGEVIDGWNQEVGA